MIIEAERDPTKDAETENGKRMLTRNRKVKTELDEMRRKEK